MQSSVRALAYLKACLESCRLYLLADMYTKYRFMYLFTWSKIVVMKNTLKVGAFTFGDFRATL